MIHLYRDDRFLDHDAGPGHPEQPERLRAVHASLDEQPILGVERVAPREATDEELFRVHTKDHVRTIRETEGEARVGLDPDTSTGPHSARAALLAAGGVVDAVDGVLSDRSRGAFVLCRPPGHHAERDAAMGFCLFNNVAVGAAHAVARGCRRVLVIDPDVHHGNGTQHSFYDRSDILFASSHRYPFYPGTGWFDEVGSGEGQGFTINLPLSPLLGDDAFLFLFEQVLGPIVDEYRPELVLVSAGFDTWHDDPLGMMAMTEAGYLRLFALFQSWADRHCQGRMVCTLEGGYDPVGVVAGVRSALGAMGREPLDNEALPSTQAPEARVTAIADNARSAFREYWPSLR